MTASYDDSFLNIERLGFELTCYVGCFSRLDTWLEVFCGENSLYSSSLLVSYFGSSSFGCEKRFEWSCRCDDRLESAC